MSDKPFLSYKEQSRSNWGSNSGGLTLDQIQAGAVLRIADAVEKMAQRHTELIAQRDNFERRLRSEEGENEYLRRRVNALRGVVTKLKKSGAAK